MLKLQGEIPKIVFKKVWKKGVSLTEVQCLHRETRGRVRLEFSNFDKQSSMQSFKSSPLP